MIMTDGSGLHSSINSQQDTSHSFLIENYTLEKKFRN